jgi:Mn-dependent DtxR family transcriptional regulator
MQAYFQVMPPSVHSMVVELEHRGLIRRAAGKARSIEVLVAADRLPTLK